IALARDKEAGVHFCRCRLLPTRRKSQSVVGGSVATTRVRGCCRCLRRRRLHRRCDCSLACCGASRLWLARTGEQHQSESRKCRTKYDCFFHKMNCFLKDNSSQVASPDVFRTKILLKRRSLPVVSLARRVSVSNREFSF